MIGSSVEQSTPISLSADLPEIEDSAVQRRAESRIEDEQGSRLRRITEQTRGLFDDVKSWVELRMELMQIEVEDRIEERVNEATVGATIAGLAGAAILFLLVAAAIALGEAFGHMAYGFLAVGGTLVVVTLVMRLVKPRFVRFRKDRSEN